MPLIVITLKNVSASLRGDLSKWLQEISQGVYVGNVNTRIREKLWSRVLDSVGVGEATITFPAKNELGYDFLTANSNRQTINYDGIPLVIVPNSNDNTYKQENKYGFSKAYKFRQAKKYASNKQITAKARYTIIDIETDGVDENTNDIIEIAALKVFADEVVEFSSLIKYNKKLPLNITKLTGITNDLLAEQGEDLKDSLINFLDFIGDDILVGYNINFDIKFLNNNLDKMGLSRLNNKNYDLLKYVKNDNMFLDSYKLEHILKHYDIDKNLIHRALDDTKIMYELSKKLNNFQRGLNKK